MIHTVCLSVCLSAFLSLVRDRHTTCAEYTGADLGFFPGAKGCDNLEAKLILS